MLHLCQLWRRRKQPFDVIYYLYKIKQFHWLLCVAKNCDWSRKITSLSNPTGASLRHLPIVLVKVAYYASGSARFLPKLCSNYARFSKLCYFLKKLFCAQTSQLTRQVVQVVQALVYPLCSRYLVNYLDVSSLHLTGLAWLPPF